MEDLRVGLLGSIILNLVRGKNESAVKPADLCPDYDGARRRGIDVRGMEPGELRALAGALAGQMGGGGGEGGVSGPTIA